MPGTFVLLKSANSQFYFNLRAENNEIILTSETYVSKAGAQNGMESVRVNAPVDQRYVRKVSTDQQHYFVLRAANNEPIGKSETYPEESAMETGISAVKRNAPSATIIDRTS